MATAACGFVNLRNNKWVTQVTTNLYSGNGNWLTEILDFLLTLSMRSVLLADIAAQLMQST